MNKNYLYVLSILTTILIVYAAWQSGQNQPPPDWVMKYLVPTLGWVYMVLVIIAIIGRKKHQK